MVFPIRLLIVSVVWLFLPIAAAADQHRVSPPANSSLVTASLDEPAAAVAKRGCPRLYPVKAWTRVAKRAYTGQRKSSRHDRRTLDRVQRCQRHRHWKPRLKRLRAGLRDRHLEALRALAEILRLTPYDCGAIGRFAVPCPIIYRESGGYWHAKNPASSAAGPYQLLDIHGRPWPIVSGADKLAHHRIAAHLWNGGAGASHWALTCC